MTNEVLRSSDALQLLGDGLLVAIDQHVEGARDAGMACAMRLRYRGWDGDGLLADQIEALIGTKANSDLNPLAVDLEDLSNILEGDPIHGGGRIDRRSGEVWSQPCDCHICKRDAEGERGRERRRGRQRLLGVGPVATPALERPAPSGRPGCPKGRPEPFGDSHNDLLITVGAQPESVNIFLWSLLEIRSRHHGSSLFSTLENRQIRRV
jgi:hypothetical protein